MKKLSKAMYGKSMMKKGGMKKMADGGPTTPGDSTMVTIKKGSYSSPSDYQAAIDSTRKSGKTVNLPKEKSPASWNKQMKGGSMKKAMYGASMDSSMMKPSMMKKGGAAKPKAMYGASMKPGMMKKGGAKKK